MQNVNQQPLIQKPQIPQAPQAPQMNRPAPQAAPAINRPMPAAAAGGQATAQSAINRPMPPQAQRPMTPPQRPMTPPQRPMTPPQGQRPPMPAQARRPVMPQQPARAPAQPPAKANTAALQAQIKQLPEFAELQKIESQLQSVAPGSPEHAQLMQYGEQVNQRLMQSAPFKQMEQADFQNAFNQR